MFYLTNEVSDCCGAFMYKDSDRCPNCYEKCKSKLTKKYKGNEQIKKAVRKENK